jgi:hypothetical protein
MQNAAPCKTAAPSKMAAPYKAATPCKLRVLWFNLNQIKSNNLFSFSIESLDNQYLIRI